MDFVDFKAWLAQEIRRYQMAGELTPYEAGYLAALEKALFVATGT